MSVCELNNCVGCYACANVCPKKCIDVKDMSIGTIANIDESACIKCNMCKKVCQAYNDVEYKQTKYAYEGWVSNDDVRKNAASGGVASQLIINFIKKGGYVASCIFKDGEFKFKLSNNMDDVSLFRGSKYVKSKPYYIYSEVKKCLENNKVLFIGLPCQVAGLYLFLKEKNINNLYTIDLICHGSPTQNIFQNYYYEMNTRKLESYQTINFRKKHNFQVYCDDKALEFEGVQDPYIIAFLEGINYSENCYSCKYARIERISDITLGDSWAYDAKDASKGVSLMLIQTEKGNELIEDESIIKKKTSIDVAIKTNHQLEHPTFKHPKRDYFFEKYERLGFKKTIRKSLPKKYYKQQIKKIMIKFKIYK